MSIEETSDYEIKHPSNKPHTTAHHSFQTSENALKGWPWTPQFLV